MALLAILDICKDPNVRDHQGRTPLMTLAMGSPKEDRTDPCAALLIDRGASLNATNRDGLTALHWAALLGRAKIVERLVNSGAEVNLKDIDGNTPLHQAATGGWSHDSDGEGRSFEKIVKTLISSGADPLLKNNDGRTADYLCDYRRPNLRKLIGDEIKKKLELPINP